MEAAKLHGLLDAIIVAVDDATVDRDVLRRGIGDVGRLLAWCQGQQAVLAQRVAAMESFAEKAVAESARIGLGAATKLLERATTVDAAPQLCAAVLDGAVSGEHVDALTRVLRSVEPGVRDELLVRAESLVDVAEASTADEFARRLRLEARRLESDDGMDRYERQRRATRLRTWTDRDTGMWCLSGRFDPHTGVKLSRALDGELARRFADAVPDTCPSDAFEKQDHLRALALVGLIEGKGSAAGRPEAIVVIDTRDIDPVVARPIVDWGLPVEIPTRVLDELLEHADIHTVVVRNGVIIDAPGVLNLGRSTRLANRAQRRALRALYTTCAIAGCAARFDRCKIHHVIEWDLDGLTDLYNLLPVCPHHHTQLHAEGWQLTLTADRTLTVTLPDGNTFTTGPPPRRGRPSTPTTRQHSRSGH